jgi:bifunctional DNase/RNase
VRIVAVREGIFFASLVFDGGVEVSSRSSDAIALALRTGTRILGSDEVLDVAGIEIPEDAPSAEDEPGEDADEYPPPVHVR